MHPRSDYEQVAFERDCDAVVIPDGFKVVIPMGTEGVVMQLLGDNYTIRVDTGYLVRVEGHDADAIGKDPTLAEGNGDGNGEIDEDRVMALLRTCYDPEIPVNIVDLGLIYGCDVVSDEDSDGIRVDVTMTLTAPGCGMGQVLKSDIEQKIGRLKGVSVTNVELVFDPPWSMERMTEEARLELGFE